MLNTVKKKGSPCPKWHTVVSTRLKITSDTEKLEYKELYQSA